MLITFLIAAIPIIFAITVHEAAHGYAAKHFGDVTAERLGRISISPLKHIDPFGTIVLPALALLFGGVLFGWAKPVPVNFTKLRNPKKDMFWVAAAGPFSNLIMAVFWGALYGYTTHLQGVTSTYLFEMSKLGIGANVALMVLNLLPIPPLDGGRIAVSLLPNHLANQLAKIERYSLLVMIGLLLLVGKFDLLTPLINSIKTLIKTIFV